jgi:hypothetical protein
MAYNVYDYEGNSLGTEDDELVEQYLTSGSAPNGENWFFFDEGIYDRFTDYEGPEGIRVVEYIIE